MNVLDVAVLGKSHFAVLVYTKGHLSFWVFDREGRLETSKRLWVNPRMFWLDAFVPLENSVAAFGGEWDSPLKDIVGKCKLYSLTLHQDLK